MPITAALEAAIMEQQNDRLIAANQELKIAAIRDITERKRVEDELRKSEEQLQRTRAELKRSNDELAQFAYVASHDLQEPLRMVISYTQLLAQRYRGCLGSDADEFIAYAVDGCNRMQRLIMGLLSYSRSGASIGALQKISGQTALDEALANLQVTVKENEALITHDALPVILTDETQLAQLFQNLIGNAIKYRSAEVPRVNVSAERNGGKEWIFSVRDNGLGIEPQYFEKIFVLFQQLHARDEFAGTGIGLLFARRLWNGWVEGSGSNLNLPKARLSSSRCLREKFNEGTKRATPHNSPSSNLFRFVAYQMLTHPNRRQATFTTAFRAPRESESVYWPWRKLHAASSRPR
jgi:light-regulated signal transduction histidine kinase (bacteriophytochrome)